MSTAKYTPGPWKVETPGLIRQKQTDCNIFCISYAAGYRPSREERKANAHRIVQCVNSHDALIHALHEAENELEWMEATTGKPCHEAVILLIRDALRAAEETI